MESMSQEGYDRLVAELRHRGVRVSAGLQQICIDHIVLAE